MQHSSIILSDRCRYRDDKPKCKVVIIYEDNAAGRRAKHFCGEVLRELVDACDISLDLWNWQVLGLFQVADTALQAAARADVVILSMHGTAELPATTKDWIERWSQRIADSMPMLVALVTPAKTERGTVASTLSYLCSLADENQICFWANTTFLSV
jgi:hypothetical protein